MTLNVKGCPSVAPVAILSESIVKTRSSLSIVPFAVAVEPLPANPATPVVGVRAESVKVNVSFASLSLSPAIFTGICRLRLPVGENSTVPVAVKRSLKSATEAVSPISMDARQFRLTF